MRKALVWIFFLTAIFAESRGRASTDLDHQYLFETVGALRTYDNVDGLFADYVSGAYREYFSQQSRFVYQDLAKADTILSQSKLPYLDLIDDQKILAQLSRSLKLQSLIRTKIRKEGPQYRITLDWLHAPSIDLIASETFTLNEAQEISKIQFAITKGMDRLIAKIPFFGHVTGRDGDSIIVNIGSAHSIAPGDELVIGTIDEAKRHPLLKAVVDWRISRTGKIVIDQVEEKIAFCKIIEEAPGRSIQRFQKVIEVQPRPEASKRRRSKSLRQEFNENAPPESDNYEEGEDGADWDGENKSKEEPGPLDLPPRMGYVAANLGIGSFTRDYGAPTTSNGGGRIGSGGYLGGKLEGQLWITGQVFADLVLGYGSGNYDQKLTSTDAASPPSTLTTSLSQFRLDVGYNFIGAEKVATAKGWIRGGYRSDSYSFPTNLTEQLGSTAFKAFFIGLGADLPVRNDIGLLLGVDFGLINSASETGLTSGDVTSSSNVDVHFGGYYRIKPRLMVRLLGNLLNQSADFGTDKSATHKALIVYPGVVFLF